jgi:[ribosomal protein S18]-alanine N-acetyltransferase
MRWPDIPAVHRIERASFPDTAWSAESFWGELAGVPASRWYLVAEVGGTVAGYGGLMAVGAEGDVQTLAVEESQRRFGIGGVLLDALVGEAMRRRCTSVLLEVAADNAAAQALYAGRGFEQVARRSGYYGPGRDAVVMRLSVRRRGVPS